MRVRRLQGLLWAVVMVIFVAPGEANAASQEPAMKVILSMDLAMGLATGNANGTQASPSDYDDAWALALAGASDDLDILGVVVTMGNNSLTAEMAVARRQVRMAGVDAPIVAGAASWLPVAGPTTYDGRELSSTCINDGVRFMAREVRKHQDVTILATGPLTDVACLALNYPKAAAQVGRVVALVGSAPGPLLFEGKSLRDFNYSMDPRALSVLVQYSTIPVTAVTFGASSSTGIPTTVVDDLAASSSAKGRYFGQASVPYARWWEEKIAPVKPVWDASVVWYALHPEDLVCATGGVQLGVGPPNTFSDDVYDWIGPEVSGGRPVTACSSYIDGAAIQRMNAAVLAAVGGE